MKEITMRTVPNENRLDETEKLLGYSFQDRTLLARALRHPSAVHEVRRCDGDNQRLEFLGDAVLGLLTADALYKRHQNVPEGHLTVWRAQLASGKALARLAQRLDIGRLIEMGRGEERTGGRTREGNLADVLEALVGAVWLDGGWDAARALFEHIAGDELESQNGNLWQQNPKGALQELTQRQWHCEPDYTVEERSGTDHAPEFRVRVQIKDHPELHAEAKGTSKRAAEVEAAAALLTQMLPGDGS
jgi:ribonuclease-3